MHEHPRFAAETGAKKAELELTIKKMINRLYGRRSERLNFSPDQLSLDFGEEDPVTVVPDVTQDEEFVKEHEKKKRRRKKRNEPDGFLNAWSTSQKTNRTETTGWRSPGRL